MIRAAVLALSSAAAVWAAGEFPAAGRKRSTPAAEGLDAARLQAAIAFLSRNAARDGVSQLASRQRCCARAGGQLRRCAAAPLRDPAVGHNSNRLFVIPEWRMVIVRLGLDQEDRELTDAVRGEFLRLAGAGLR